MVQKNDPNKPALAASSRVTQVGRDPAKTHGFVNPPVYRGSTVLFPTVEALKARTQTYTYGRRGTPTVSALEDAIRELEAASFTMLTASGLQACSTALLAFVESGDNILVSDSVYQPTRAFCDSMLKRLGVETTYYDPLVGADIRSLIKENTKLIFCESPGSQTFEVQDISAMANVAKDCNVWLLMDNTWATPLYFQPLSHGVDVSIQAATKYIVGHADALLGCISGNERASPYLVKAREALGTCPGSEETFLGLRGLRTLDVRLERHYRSGLDIAHWLASHPCVNRVMHPGLESDPGHAIWSRDFCGASGLFGITLKPVPERAIAAMLDGLKLFGMGYSWGGFESLILPFDVNRFRSATTWEDPGPCLRLHIGLEDAGDLIADLEAGFARLTAANE